MDQEFTENNNVHIVRVHGKEVTHTYTAGGGANKTRTHIASNIGESTKIKDSIVE